MKLFGQTSSREVRITFGIWIILLLAGATALVIVRTKTASILDNIYNLNAPNSAKAQILYDQAQANAQKVFQLAESLNKTASDHKSIPSDQPDLLAAMKNFNQAFKIDPYAEFDKSRTRAYETISQLMDASGNKSAQVDYAARAFISLGDYGNAKDYLEDLITSDPKALEPRVLSAQLMLLEGKSTEAVSTLSDSISSETLNAKGHYVLAKALENIGNSEQAISNFQSAIIEEKDNIRYRVDLANALSNAGNIPQAIKSLSDGLEMGGEQDAVYMHVLGELYLKSNQPYLAVKSLERADKLAPFSGDVQLSLARAYKKAGKSRQSDSALRRAIQVNPELADKLL